jgi:hypothetical protein
METIDKILEELRSGEFARLADRIEAATKALIADRDNWRKQALAEDARANAATCKDSLQVGNAAKMREALRKCDNYLDIGDAGLCASEVRAMYEVMQEALSAPARNCDLYATDDEAYQAYLKVMENTPEEERVYFESWLFAEAKGK